MKKVIEAFSQMLLLTIFYIPLSILLGLFGWYVLSAVFHYEMSLLVLIGTVHVCIVTLSFVFIGLDAMYSALKLMGKPELLDSFMGFIPVALALGFLLWFVLKEFFLFDMGLVTAMWFTYICMILYLYLYNGFLALGNLTNALFNKVFRSGST